MTVAELRLLLQQAPQDAKVFVWNCYRDEMNFDVRVSVDHEGHAYIGDDVFGKEIK